MPNIAVLTLILALCTMTGAIGIDTYLPAFHSIAEEFDVGPAVVQQTLSAYLIAMAVTMLFAGTLSDTFGRKRVMMVSQIGFGLTAVACALAPSIESLITIRALQGLFGGMGMVLVRAMVQDRFQGAEAQRMMSMVIMVFGLAPALAPILGGFLQLHWGWRSTFWFLAAFGLLLTISTWTQLPETLPKDKRVPLKLRIIFGNYVHALRNRHFRLMLLGLGLMAGANAVYISSAAEFVSHVLGLSATSYAWLFLPLISGTMLGAAASGALARRMKPLTQQYIAYGFMLTSGVMNISYHLWTDQPSVPWAVVPIGIYTFGSAMLQPVLTVKILSLFPQMRGLASSLQGFVQMSVFAAIAGALVPHLFHSGLALAVGQSTIVIAGMLLWAFSTRFAAAPEAPATASTATGDK